MWGLISRLKNLATVEIMQEIVLSLCLMEPICEGIYDRFECDIHYMGRLTKFCLSGIVLDYITTFEQLEIHIDGFYDSFFKNASLVVSKRKFKDMSL